MKYEIKNIAGIDCIFAPMNEWNSITIDIWVKAGSAYETKEESWISHVLEHMFFKGWKKRKTPKEVATAMDKIGAIFNAWTGEHTTNYFVKSAPQFAEYWLEVLADMLMDAQFAEWEFQREKGVIIQELKMYEDSPISVVWNKWQTYFLWDNSYWRPTIWFEENIRNFTRDDLFNYKKTFYAKDNLIITIAWKILDQAALEKNIEKLFKDLPEKCSRKKPEFKRNLPKNHKDFFKKDTEQNHIIISMKGLNNFDDRRYAASLLCSMLWWNMSSRLFQEIREKLWICYYISAGHWGCNEYWIFSVRAWLDKTKFEFWVKKINEVIDNFLDKWFTDEEFSNAKNCIKWGIQMGIESSDEMAWYLWNQYIMKNEIHTLDEVLEKYEALKKEDIIELFPMLKEENRYRFHIE